VASRRVIPLLMAAWVGCGDSERDPVVGIPPLNDGKAWVNLNLPYDISPDNRLLAMSCLDLTDFCPDACLLMIPELTTRVVFGCDSVFASLFRFSPDGTKVAFVKDYTADIFVLNLETMEERQITFTGGNAVYPDWDPTSRFIVYSRPVGRYGEPDSSSGLHIVDTETLLDRSLRHGGEPTHGANPRWSPDGASIVFSLGTPIGPGTRPPMALHIYRVNVDGTGYTDLTPADRRHNQYPMWIGSGEEILYESSDEHTFQIHETRVMGEYGQNVRRWVVNIRPYHAWVAISRDGTFFVNAMPDSSNTYLVLYRQDLRDASGVTRMQLTRVPSGPQLSTGPHVARVGP
jgi:dipeptidyl aminopeptidase/acylaminoacyl peptidase